MNTNVSTRADVSLSHGVESARRQPRDLSTRVVARRASSARAVALACAALLLACASARAATLPAGFAETQIATGLTNATAMAFAPDGRVFVCLQGGQLRVVKNGALLPTPFVTLTVNSFSERGLLGLAFDPNFASNRFIYVYYTATTPAIHNRISRFTASAANPDVAEAGSEVVILDLENLSAGNHNGGAMHFGADGKLYVAVGENAVPSNSQTLANKLGKILRLNTDPANVAPADNPFFATATGTNRTIWAMGLRNPFTFNVQPGTGRIFINDVGQSAIEEINDGLAGQNYGWPSCEGACPIPAPTPVVRPPNTFTDPVFQYNNDGTTCAITGGTFYNPVTQQFPAEYAGKYFYSDFCGGWIRRYDPQADTSTDFATGASSPVDLQVSSDGSLWYLERGNTGRLMRVRFTANAVPPSITQHPQGQTVAAGQSVTFTVAASGPTPFSYQWQRNNVDIPGATSDSYTFTAALGDNGAQYRAIVTNPFGSTPSNPATLTVTTGTPSGAGVILISEYRLDGPGGLTDEFVEIYNNTDLPVTVSTADGSAGWALVRGRDASGLTAFDSYHVIPAGTIIPARGHYLMRGAQYSLADYGGTGAAAGDAAAALDLGGDGSPFLGIALFRSSTNFTLAERLDAAGCPTISHPLLVEGAGAGPCANVGTVAQPAANYSLVRKLDGGTPQDTNDNAADFRLVAVTSPLAAPATGGTLPSALGAPGPENLASPLPRAQIKASLLDPQSASSAAPNRTRDTTPHVCNGGTGPSNCTFGTLSIRRKFTNSTGAAVTRLRFRILQVTTLGALAPGEADLRALTSGDVSIVGVTGTVRGTTLEEPPAQALGGGFNSSLSSGTVSLATPLAAGNSINVQFVLGVQQTGNFRFFINVEALPGSSPAAPSTLRKGTESPVAGKDGRP